MKFLMQVLLALGFFIHTISAVELPDFTVLAEEQGNKVVNISSIVERVNNQNNIPFQDERMQEFFKRFGIPNIPGVPPQGNSQEPEERVNGTGSGFIIESDGYIITNAHVVAQADSVLVKLADKREFKAEILGVDRRTDVALLKIKAKNLPKVKFGNPEKIKVGQWVAAIGSPFGLENTMTVGVVSAKGRALPQENFVPFIQTDVAINPGNSGGPLFNTDGEVIGINSQIYSRTGGYMGLSFAIPIDVAINVAEQLKKNGKVIRGWLGVAIQEITEDLSESFGMKDTRGALIAMVEKDSPAEKGGILPGDVILKFNNNPLDSSSDLPKFVGTTKPLSEVPVEILRKGKKVTLSIKVGEMPNEEMKVAGNKGPVKEVNRIGLSLRELTEEDRKSLNGRNGLLVLEAKGPSISSGIRAGDVILALNNTAVQSMASFNKDIRKVPKGKTIALLIYRNGDTLYIPVKVTD
ncbi:MAG: protease Do [Methylophilales bacterium BACL14 MAG-120910-bin43]|jgi:serine protease Do|nr:MAG: protease Do [Methylophilales bacterium BACL14 MAG-120910-bin43]KRP06959.1 MAG: protease Do [Methylophilales bacterium BACL14 MAG-120920-bin58]